MRFIVRSVIASAVTATAAMALGASGTQALATTASSHSPESSVPLSAGAAGTERNGAAAATPASSAGSASAQALVSPALGTLELFTKARNGTVSLRRFANSGWGGVTSMGRASVTAPAAAADSDGDTVLVVTGKGGRLLLRSAVGTRWSRWVALPGTTSARPALAAKSPGVFSIVIRTASGAAAIGTWRMGTRRFSGWSSLGGALASGPAVAASASGGLVVLAVGRKAQLLQLTISATGRRSRWASLGGRWAGDPALAADPWTGQMYLAAVSTHGALRSRTRSAAGRWGRLQRLPGRWSASPAIASPGPGQAVVVESGTRGQYEQSLLAARRWLPFAPIAALKVSRALRVLQSGQVTAVTGPPSGPQTVTLASGVPAPPVGAILAAGVTTATPDGLLVQVTSAVANADGTKTVTTTPATLSQAVSNASIDVSASLSADDEASSPGEAARRSLSLAQVTPRVAGAAASPVSQAISKNLSCSASVSAALTGSLSITPSFQLTADLGLTGVKSVSLTGSLSEDAQLSAAVAAAASCNLASTPLLAQPIDFDPIVFDIGPVPVVILPELQFYVAASGQVQAQLTATAEQKASATAGLMWAGGKLSPVATLSNSFSFATTPPAQQLTGHLTGSIEPELSLLLDGVAGSKITATASVTLDVAPASTPTWKLTAGFDAGADLVIPALHIDKGDDHIIQFERLLAPQPYLYFEHCNNPAKGCTSGSIERTTLGGGATQVLQNVPYNVGVGFAVSPDDRFIVYPQDVSDGSLLYIRNLAAGTTTQLTKVGQPCPQYDDFPTWSPDNKWIIFNRGTFGDICPAKDSPAPYRITPAGTGLLRLPDTFGMRRSRGARTRRVS